MDINRQFIKEVKMLVYVTEKGILIEILIEIYESWPTVLRKWDLKPQWDTTTLLLPDWQKLKYSTTIIGNDRAARNYINCWIKCKMIQPTLGNNFVYSTKFESMHILWVLLDTYSKVSLSNRNRTETTCIT